MSDKPYTLEEFDQNVRFDEKGGAFIKEFDLKRMRATTERADHMRVLCLDLVALLDVFTNIDDMNAVERRAAVARAEALIERAKQQLANDTPT